MSSETSPVSKTALWAGRIMSAVPVLILTMSGVMKIAMSGQEEFQKQVESSGMSIEIVIPLAIVELTCVAVYVMPWTSVLGAILITGYMGGATATHVQMGDYMVFLQVGIGVLAWGGLYLRDRRIRALIPLYSKTPAA